MYSCLLNQTVLSKWTQLKGLHVPWPHHTCLLAILNFVLTQCTLLQFFYFERAFPLCMSCFFNFQTRHLINNTCTVFSFVSFKVFFFISGEIKQEHVGYGFKMSLSDSSLSEVLSHLRLNKFIPAPEYLSNWLPPSFRL